MLFPRLLALALLSGLTGWTASAAAAVDETTTATGVVFLDANANGVRDAGEQPLAGVGVSNGDVVVETDADGRYALPVGGDLTIFVIKPAGYATGLSQDRLPRFYYVHNPQGTPPQKFRGVDPTGSLPASIDFGLVPQDEPDDFSVLFFGDTQPRDQKEIDYIAHDVIESLVGDNAAFGVTLGDIMFDDLNLFESLNRTIAQIGVPWYNVIGNHDIDFSAPDDQRADDVFERIYGPAYYSFNYGPVHFIALDDVEWIVTPAKKFYRSGLSEQQLNFVRNDLARVPQDQLVVVMMHIPLVKSTEWEESDRQELFRILESRTHCVSLSGHTHHHEHVMIGADDGWKGDSPHHHIINVTVCGGWWSGQPDESGVPHATCADGTPNGFTRMHFAGAQYRMEYVPARRETDDQIRVVLPEVVASDLTGETTVTANVFNAFPDAAVTMRVSDLEPITMTRTPQKDPVFEELSNIEKAAIEAGEELAWRAIPNPMVCPHLWAANLPADLVPGTYTVHVAAKNPNGQILTGQRIVRIAPPSSPVVDTDRAGP